MFFKSFPLLLLLGISLSSADAPDANIKYVEATTDLLFERTLYQNNQKNFSWTDPELQRRLYGGNLPKPSAEYRAALHDRALNDPLGKTWGPAIRVLSCIGCAKLAAPAALRYWTTDQFLKDIKVTKDQTRDKCVFYGRRERANMFPAGLSQIAVDFACNTGKTTIWHMWPRGQTNVFPGSSPTNSDGPLDYYAMFTKGSHLEPINKAGLAARTEYFENMSRAVALTCMGRVYVMSDKAENFKSGEAAGGIWWEVELPTLRTRLNELATLTAISTKDYTRGYNVRWSDGATIPGPVIVPREVQEELRQLQEFVKRQEAGEEAQITKRSECLVPGAYEPIGVDFFG